jgi:putative flippase GtrA
MSKIRFVRFLTVGVCTAVVDFGMLAILRGWIPPTAAFSGAYLAGAVTHFLLNKHWTFRCARTDLAKQVAEYLAVVGITYLVQLAGFRGGFALFNHNVFLAKAIAVPPGTIIGYLLLRMRVFKDVPRPAQMDD